MTNKHGEPIACTAWKDFALAPDARFGNAQGAVKDAFWANYLAFLDICAMFINTALTILHMILQKRYRVDPADVCARKVCRDAFSNARLRVTNQFMKQVKGLPVLNFRQYSDT